MVTTVVVPSKNPSAPDGGVHMPTLMNEIYAAFPGRDIFAINVSDYGATITVGFNDAVQPTDAATLSAVIAAHDPNSLTPEEQAAADLAAELELIQSRITALAADIIVVTGDANAVPPTTGLKGTLAAAAWNPLTNAQKIELLRTNQQAVLDIQLDVLRSTRYLLRQMKLDKTGVASMAAGR